VKEFGSAAKTSFFYKRDKNDLPNWKLSYEFKCASTEIELSKYLSEIDSQITTPVAIISRQQFSGFGRYDRKWFSPNGGIWMSAAYPVISNEFLTEIFSISIAYFLCEMFLRESIEVKIKWPNDIFCGSKKLIGFLPGVVTRGKKIIYVRLGIGMNLNNHTPQQAISLSKILGKKNLNESYWTSKILKVIYDAINYNQDRISIIRGANKFLDKNLLPRDYEGSKWTISNINSNGNLIIFKDKNYKILNS